MSKLYFESDEVRKIVNETIENAECADCDWYVLRILEYMKDEINQLTEHDIDILSVSCDDFVKIHPLT